MRDRRLFGRDEPHVNNVHADHGRLKEWMQTSAWRVDQGQGPLPPIAYSLDFPDEMIAALLPIWARQAETEDFCVLPRS